MINLLAFNSSQVLLLTPFIQVVEYVIFKGKVRL